METEGNIDVQGVNPEKIFEGVTAAGDLGSGDTAVSERPCLKDELRLKILERRKQEGKPEISLDDVRYTPKNYPLTKQELDNREKRRLSNRLAALRCRAKKRRQYDQAYKQKHMLLQRRAELERSITELEKEISDIRFLWRRICTSDNTKYLWKLTTPGDAGGTRFVATSRGPPSFRTASGASSHGPTTLVVHDAPLIKTVPPKPNSTDRVEKSSVNAGESTVQLVMANTTSGTTFPRGTTVPLAMTNTTNGISYQVASDTNNFEMSQLNASDKDSVSVKAKLMPEWKALFPGRATGTEGPMRETNTPNVNLKHCGITLSLPQSLHDLREFGYDQFVVDASYNTKRTDPSFPSSDMNDIDDSCSLLSSQSSQFSQSSQPGSSESSQPGSSDLDGYEEMQPMDVMASPCDMTSEGHSCENSSSGDDSDIEIMTFQDGRLVIDLTA